MTAPSLTEAVAQALTPDTLKRARKAYRDSVGRGESWDSANAAMRAVLAAALAPVIEQWGGESELWKERYERPFVRFECWPCDQPVDGKQKYRIGGYRDDGLLVLLRPMFLHDMIIDTLTVRAEAAEQQVAALTARVKELDRERTLLQDRSKAVQRGPS